MNNVSMRILLKPSEPHQFLMGFIPIITIVAFFLLTFIALLTIEISGRMSAWSKGYADGVGYLREAFIDRRDNPPLLGWNSKESI